MLCGEEKTKKKCLKTLSELPRSSGSGTEQPSPFLVALPERSCAVSGWGTTCQNLDLLLHSAKPEFVWHQFQQLQEALAFGCWGPRCVMQGLTANESGKLLRTKKTNSVIEIRTSLSFYLAVSHKVILDWEEHLNLPVLLTQRYYYKRRCLEKLLMRRADALRWKASSQ